MWNEVPENVVEAGTTTTLIQRLHKYMDKKGLERMGQTCANGTSSVGASWSGWTSWAESLFPCCMTGQSTWGQFKWEEMSTKSCGRSSRYGK